MTLISLIIVLIVIGLILWLIDMLPIDAKIKMIIRVILIIVCILWLLSVLGLFTDIKIGR